MNGDGEKERKERKKARMKQEKKKQNRGNEKEGGEEEGRGKERKEGGEMEMRFWEQKPPYFSFPQLRFSFYDLGRNEPEMRQELKSATTKKS